MYSRLLDDQLKTLSPTPLPAGEGLIAMLWSWPEDARRVREHVLAGGVFAYATEAVFGLGGHPGMDSAVQAILRLKAGRRADQGMILVAGSKDEAQGFVREMEDTAWQAMLAAQAERPTTFLLLAGEKVSPLLVVDGKVALRLSRHAQVAALTAFLRFPLLSTSANVHGGLPARSVEAVRAVFPDVPVLQGETGDERRPSRIVDWVSGRVLRD